jgi:hypothetical protein
MEHDDLQEMVRAVRQFVRSEVVPEETTSSRACGELRAARLVDEPE